MLRHELVENEGILIVRPGIPLTVNDFARLAAEIDPHIEGNGDRRELLTEAESIPGWDDVDAFLSHCRFIRDHHRHIGKVSFPFGDCGSLRRCRSALLSNVHEEYRDFGVMAAAALDIIAARSAITLSAAASREILGGMRALPAHPEAPGAIARLKQFGCQVDTGTNSSSDMVDDQLRNLGGYRKSRYQIAQDFRSSSRRAGRRKARLCNCRRNAEDVRKDKQAGIFLTEIALGLVDLFEAGISDDAVRCFEPARVVYEIAVELGEDAGNLWLAAANNRDTTGALRAGWKTAFVQRPGMVFGPLDMTAKAIGRDLGDVANKLIATLAQ